MVLLAVSHLYSRIAELFVVIECYYGVRSEEVIHATDRILREGTQNWIIRLIVQNCILKLVTLNWKDRTVVEVEVGVRERRAGAHEVVSHIKEVRVFVGVFKCVHKEQILFKLYS